MHIWGGVVGAGFLHITMIFCLYSGQLPDIPKVEFDYVQLDSVPMPILETCIHTMYYVHSKGQIISKGIFGILGFFQKTNEQIRF